MNRPYGALPLLRQPPVCRWQYPSLLLRTIRVYTDYRLTYLIGTTNETQSKYYTLKYNPSVESVVEAMENPMIPVIRFSEICHILAEISSYNGKITEGINYLETVRKARGAERTLSLTVSTR